jgi:Ca2+-binding RTX toxin-like protein
VLTRGAGYDSFVFSTALVPANQITDCSAPCDAILLENAVVTTLLARTSVLSATAFALGTAAETPKAASTTIAASGALHYGADVTRQMEQVPFAILTSHPGNVTTADFLVI